MIKRNPCNIEGCNYPRFAKGFCKNHQQLRTDKKKKKLKRSPIKKRYKPTGEKALFDAIAKTRDLKSYISCKDLSRFINSGMYVNIFAHVLNKGYYSKFRLYEKNIVLLTPDEHYLFDHGTKLQRNKYREENDGKVDWNKLYRLKDELKKEYYELDSHTV